MGRNAPYSSPVTVHNSVACLKCERLQHRLRCWEYPIKIEEMSCFKCGGGVVNIREVPPEMLRRMKAKRLADRYISTSGQEPNDDITAWANERHIALSTVPGLPETPEEPLEWW